MATELHPHNAHASRPDLQKEELRCCILLRRWLSVDLLALIPLAGRGIHRGSARLSTVGISFAHLNRATE